MNKFAHDKSVAYGQDKIKFLQKTDSLPIYLVPGSEMIAKHPPCQMKGIDGSELLV